LAHRLFRISAWLAFLWNCASKRTAAPSSTRAARRWPATPTRPSASNGTRPTRTAPPRRWAGCCTRTCPAAASHCGAPACARCGYGILAATVGRDITERLHGFVELAAPRIARANRGGTQAVFDAGVTWLVTNDIQLDAALSRCLNRRMPDLDIGLGLSVRR
jgi:hypothetical protein